MASACVNNVGDNFPTSFPSYGWLSPRISISRDDDTPKSKSPKPPPPENSDPDDFSVNDFEFHLEDPVAMLTADELFSNGKLMPLQLSSLFPPAATAETSPETPKTCRNNEISGIIDPYLFSPKAPRCSSRWKELLGLKRLYHKQQQEINNNNNSRHKSLFSISNNNNISNTNSKSMRNVLHRSSKSHDSSLSLPLLKESFENNETNSVSSFRLSLSSSSSGHDEIDLPRLSLDTDKSSSSSSQMQKNTLSGNPARIRLVKTSRDNNNNNNNNSNNNKMVRCREINTNSNNSSSNNLNTGRGLSVDSPRMNSSGKIVFHGLERSSSSPSSFNGGVRYKQHRGMERSYSANVRVTPLLNVPVCSSLRGSSKSGGVFGFPIFSAPLHKRNGGAGGAPTHKTQQQMSSKSKTDRV